MADRRPAVVMIAGLLLVAPGCRFSGSTDSEAAPPTTVASTIPLFGDPSTTAVDGSTTTAVATASALTTRRVATTARAAGQPTTRPTAARVAATTTRPAVPHCTASAADTAYGSTWTVSVTSTFPSSEVVLDLSWGAGNVGNYSGITDGSGSYQKTQRVQPTMRGQTVSVAVRVASRVSCSTSFRVS